MGRDLLRLFNGASIFQVGGDPGRPEGVAANRRWKARGTRPPLNHLPNFTLVDTTRG